MLKEKKVLMGTKTVLSMNRADLRTQVLNKIGELGCSCPADLAGEIGGGATADDLIPVVKSLVESGDIRRKENDLDDHRVYKGDEQTIYELNR